MVSVNLSAGVSESICWRECQESICGMSVRESICELICWRSVSESICWKECVRESICWKMGEGVLRQSICGMLVSEFICWSILGSLFEGVYQSAGLLKVWVNPVSKDKKKNHIKNINRHSWWPSAMLEHLTVPAEQEKEEEMACMHYDNWQVRLTTKPTSCTILQSWIQTQKHWIVKANTTMPEICMTISEIRCQFQCTVIMWGSNRRVDEWKHRFCAKKQVGSRKYVLWIRYHKSYSKQWVGTKMREMWRKWI